MKDNEMITLRNRNNGVTGYTIADMGIRRQFGPDEKKNIEFKELRGLMYTPGGDYLIKNMFIVSPRDALVELGIEVEPEYFYNKATIRKILLGSGEETLDQLADMLDFAPEGVIELARDIAVNEEIPDARKRQMISERTGFSVDGAINLRKQMMTEEEQKAKADENKKRRRTAPVADAEEKKPRRIYKPVIEPDETDDE